MIAPDSAMVGPMMQESRRCILALDLERDISWAIQSPDGGIVHGVDDVGERYKHSHIAFFVLRSWLSRIARDADKNGVSLEIVYREGNSLVHLGWLPHLKKFCELTGAPLRSINGSAVKRHVTGKGNASAEQVKTAIEDLGYTPGADNEAAAIATLLFFAEEVEKQS
jgi:hypothetical protein